MKQRILYLVGSWIVVSLAGTVRGDERNLEVSLRKDECKLAYTSSTGESKPRVPTKKIKATEKSQEHANNEFAGKIVVVQVSSQVKFVLEDVTVAKNGSETFLTGTGIKWADDDLKKYPSLGQWWQGLPVHVNLHTVDSYTSVAMDQWKDVKEKVGLCMSCDPVQAFGGPTYVPASFAPVQPLRPSGIYAPPPTIYAPPAATYSPNKTYSPNNYLVPVPGPAPIYFTRVALAHFQRSES